MTVQAYPRSIAVFVVYDSLALLLTLIFLQSPMTSSQSQQGAKLRPGGEGHQQQQQQHHHHQNKPRPTGQPEIR
jgi:hypothetical protein